MQQPLKQPTPPPRTFRLRRNFGPVEAGIRIAAGIAILGAGVYFRSWWGLLGLIPLLTGVLRYCPAYSLFGRKGTDNTPPTA